jgi:hypothetical protein
MGAALEYVEAFTKLIVRNKPAAVIAAKQAAAQEHSEDADSTDAVPAPSESFRGAVTAPRPQPLTPTARLAARLS